MKRTFLAALTGIAFAIASLTLVPQAHAQDVRSTQWLDVEIGQSFIFQRDRPIGRVLVSDPQVAEIKMLETGQFQIRGLQTGATDLWVWYRDDRDHPESYSLTVHRDLSDLIRRIDGYVEGTPPRAYPMLDRLVIEGAVPDVETLERIASVAQVYDKDFVNLMTVTGDHQIQLEVVFAEVNRTALRELGLNALWGDNNLGLGIQGPNATGSGFVSRPEASQIASGYTMAPSAGTFNLMGIVGSPIDIAAIMSVLEQNSVSKILAQPTLVALSGQQAEFLAGGEVPVPVAQTGNRITLEFKEYGVKLVFVPTVLAKDVVDMRVYVEVSDIDSTTAIRLTGIEIPGFQSRKSQSHLRVESGMTFAMAGMLHETMRSTNARVPVLGDIPLVGALFRYVQHRRTEDELMIFVTPRLVRPMAQGEVPDPPGITENNNPNDFELFLLGLDHAVGSRTAEPTGPIGLQR